MHALVCFIYLLDFAYCIVLLLRTVFSMAPPMIFKMFMPEIIFLKAQARTKGAVSIFL